MSSSLPPRRHRGWLFALLILLGFASIAFAAIAGSDGVRPALLLQWFSNSLPAQDNLVVAQLRMPRALSAFAVGGLLAIAGVLMQVLLRNPLADPYILGTSGGAAAAALLAMLLGMAGAVVDVAAFAGACLATFIVFGIGGVRSQFSPVMLLLTGVVLASGFGALVSLMLAISPDGTLRGMLFWLMGDFSLALDPLPVMLVLAIALIASMLASVQLNVLAQSETSARLLGLPLIPMRIFVLLLASLLTAFAVTQAGSIGFIGLVVPHLVRRFSGNDHRVLLPSALLAGGALLTRADTLWRSLLAPRQLPGGTLTAAGVDVTRSEERRGGEGGR